MPDWATVSSLATAGGTLVMASEDARRDPRTLLQVLVQDDIERLFLPFVALQNLCETAEQANVSLPLLRDVITAGEQLKATPASVTQNIVHSPSCC